MTAKEKMTAPIASVGADVEQSSSNKLTNQSIADRTTVEGKCKTGA